MEKDTRISIDHSSEYAYVSICLKNHFAIDLIEKIMLMAKQTGNKGVLYSESSLSKKRKLLIKCLCSPHDKLLNFVKHIML